MYILNRVENTGFVNIIMFIIFFDIHIFECWLPNRDEPDAAIKSMRDYLENSDLIWEEFSTYQWDNGKQ